MCGEGGGGAVGCKRVKVERVRVERCGKGNSGGVCGEGGREGCMERVRGVCVGVIEKMRVEGCEWMGESGGCFTRLNKRATFTKVDVGYSLLSCSGSSPKLIENCRRAHSVTLPI